MGTIPCYNGMGAIQNFCNLKIEVKGPVTFPTIVVLGPKVRSNLISIVQFIVVIPNLASDLPYVAFFGGK